MKWFILLVSFDQLTKYLANYRDIVQYNSGLSFGLASGWQVTLFVLIGLVLLIYLFKKMSLPRWFLILFFAGAVSNLLDRFLYNGQVRDWLLIPFTFIVNNLADWYIFSAVTIYILKYIYEYRKNLRR